MLQLVGALVLALATGVLVFQWMAVPRNAPTAAVRADNATAVVVAAKDLDRGAAIDAAMLRTVRLPAESLPQNAFSDPATLVGRTLRERIYQNEPLTEARLVPKDGGAGISAMIAPGKRAIAVKGNKVLGLAGFIRPGNRVDVLVTIDNKQVPGRIRTKTVLENIPVLATGTELEDNGKGEPSPVDTYTLELTPAEGERLSLAATKGTLHFALRNPADETLVATPGASVKSTLSIASSSDKAKTRRRPDYVVEVLRGGQRQIMGFWRNAK
jgi:pilus assembly protein CpaB